MDAGHKAEWNRWKAWLQRIAAAVVFIIGVVTFISDYLIGKAPLPPPTCTNVFLLILPLGLAAGIAHALLWADIENWFGWTFGAGGSGAMPSGFSAVALSLSLTFPLAFVPLLAQKLMSQQLIPPDYMRGALALLISGCLGHIVMYGLSTKWRGLRSMIIPTNRPIGFSRLVFSEIVYALIYFGLMGISFRAFSQPSIAWPDIEAVGVIAAAALWFILIMSGFSYARYPNSLNDPTWVQVRGFLSGQVLSVCLVAAMFG